MYYHACPYCMPSRKAFLIRKTWETVKCKYKKEDICEDKHKCKEIMQCNNCNEIFTLTKKFLETQKRKIKDG